MIEWKDFKTHQWDMFSSDREITNIKCPECGAPLYRRTDIVLASYPPKHRYECSKCEWFGIA